MRIEEGVYHGQVDENNLQHGKGRLFFKNGKAYTGEWVRGIMEGTGLLASSNGAYYKGSFASGNFSGLGEHFCPIKMQKYIGMWKAGKRHGKGQIFYDKKQNHFRGSFERGKRHGGGQMFKNEYLLTGNWEKGRKHGRFRLIDSKNEQAYCITFKRDEKRKMESLVYKDLDIDMILADAEIFFEIELPFCRFLKNQSKTENSENMSNKIFVQKTFKKSSTIGCGSREFVKSDLMEIEEKPILEGIAKDLNASCPKAITLKKEFNSENNKIQKIKKDKSKQQELVKSGSKKNQKSDFAKKASENKNKKKKKKKPLIKNLKMKKIKISSPKKRSDSKNLTHAKVPKKSPRFSKVLKFKKRYSAFKNRLSILSVRRSPAKKSRSRSRVGTGRRGWNSVKKRDVFRFEIN